MRLHIVLVAAFFGNPVFADRQSFPPIDEAAQDPSVAAFRADLLTKVRDRQIDAVISASCDDIELGQDSGLDAWRATLTSGPDAPAEDATVPPSAGPDAIWTALEDTLAQPGYFDDQGEFWMPHQWQITLPASLDPGLAFFVTGENVTLRQSASRDAPVVGLISHEVVLVPTFLPDLDYQRVLLTDGTPGYMHRDFLWSMTGYRAALVKSDAGDWQLCTFVTGD